MRKACSISREKEREKCSTGTNIDDKSNKGEIKIEGFTGESTEIAQTPD